MSMNLIFGVKNNTAWIDFPFQTPTDLTYSVLKEPDNNKKLELIKIQLEQWEWDKNDIESMIIKIKELLNNPNLEIGMI